jgi:hypothetical protein
VYLWASGVAEYAPWPGIAMTDEGNGIYGFELPAALDGKTMNVIFSNNGANQHPDMQSRPGTQMILTAEGQWIPYVPAQEEPPSTPPTEPTEPSENSPEPEKTPPIGLVLSIAGSVCLAGALMFFVLKKRKK